MVKLFTPKETEEQAAVRRLIILGPTPAKKNRWHRGKNGGMYFDQTARNKMQEGSITEQIAALTWQARSQWGARPPLIHPAMTLVFYVKDQRGDLDNMLSTTLDILKVAGVLRDDNMKHFKGPVTFWGEIDKEQERTEISFEAIPCR